MFIPSFVWLLPSSEFSELTLIAYMLGASEARCMSHMH